MYRLAITGVLVIAGCGRVGYESVESTDPTDPDPVQITGCEALAPIEGTRVDISPADAAQLPAIAAAAQPGDTLVLASGTYPLSEPVVLSAQGMSLRSASGNPSDVVLDADWGITVVDVEADGVTVAEVTLTRGDVLLRAGSGAPSNSLAVHRVRFVDAINAALRVNSVDGAADDGVVACSRFVQTDAGRETGCQLGDESTMGIQAQAVRGWRITANRFDGYYCAGNTTARAIVADRGSRDVEIDRNIIRDSFIGIQLGLSETAEGDERVYADPPACAAGGFVDFAGGTVCSNIVFRSSAVEPRVDTGIAVWQGCDVTFVHNTVASPTDVPTFSSIEWRFGNTTNIEVINNLVSGELRARDGAVADETANIVFDDPDAAFVDLQGGDLHLTADNPAIDVAVPGTGCVNDIDLEPRGSAPDVGADER